MKASSVEILRDLNGAVHENRHQPNLKRRRRRFQDAADACNAAAEKLKTSTDETSKDADVQTQSESERLARF